MSSPETDQPLTEQLFEPRGDTAYHRPADSSDTRVAGLTYANPGSPQGPPPVRAGTMVWGLLVLVLGLGAMAVATGRRVDLEIALISLFVLAGVGLLAGSLIGAAQRARRRDRADQVLP